MVSGLAGRGALLEIWSPDLTGGPGTEDAHEHLSLGLWFSDPPARLEGAPGGQPGHGDLKRVEGCRRGGVGFCCSLCWSRPPGVTCRRQQHSHMLEGSAGSSVHRAPGKQVLKSLWDCATTGPALVSSSVWPAGTSTLVENLLSKQAPAHPRPPKKSGV